MTRLVGGKNLKVEDFRRPRNVCPYCGNLVTKKNFIPDGHKLPDGQMDKDTGLHDCGALVHLKKREGSSDIRKVILKESPVSRPVDDIIGLA